MTHISVCMATYNGGRFVGEQIASILPQLRKDDELIISDDGSTDETLSTIRQFNDSRIILLPNQSLKSVTRNFENALRNATGTYIFLSDQDDVWYPNKVETFILHLQQCDLLVSNCDFIDENGQAIDISFFDSYKSGPGVIKNFFKNTFLGNCMAFHRQVLERSLPFPGELHQASKYLIYQDVWLGMLANCLYKVKFIPEKLSAYRRHSDNASPTGVNLRSNQSLNRKLRGRTLLAIGLLKRILRIA